MNPTLPHNLAGAATDILRSAPIAAGIATVGFLLIRRVPGDIVGVRGIGGTRAYGQQDAMRESLGLTRGWGAQFAGWLGWTPAIGDMVVPALILGIETAGTWARMLHEDLRDTGSAEFVRTARAEGLPWWKIVPGHSLPDAVTVDIALFGLPLARALTGAIAMEAVVGLPGLGTLTLRAIRGRDCPLVQAMVIRLGQVAHRAVARRPRPGRSSARARRSGAVRRRRPADARARGAAAPARPADRRDLSGSGRRAEPAPPCRRADRRGGAALSARVVGRTAAARDDRPCARGRSRSAGRRRAATALEATVQAQVPNLPSDPRERRGLRLIRITHSLPAAAPQCDDLAVMAAGRRVGRGTVAALLARPQSAALRAMLAAAEPAAPQAAAADRRASVPV